MDISSFIKVTQELVVFFYNSTPSLEHYTVKLIKLFYVVLRYCLFYLWLMFQTLGREGSFKTTGALAMAPGFTEQRPHR